MQETYPSYDRPAPRTRAPGPAAEAASAALPDRAAAVGRMARACRRHARSADRRRQHAGTLASPTLDTIVTALRNRFHVAYADARTIARAVQTESDRYRTGAAARDHRGRVGLRSPRGQCRRRARIDAGDAHRPSRSRRACEGSFRSGHQRADWRGDLPRLSRRCGRRRRNRARALQRRHEALCGSRCACGNSMRSYAVRTARQATRCGRPRTPERVATARRRAGSRRPSP